MNYTEGNNEKEWKHFEKGVYWTIDKRYVMITTGVTNL